MDSLEEERDLNATFTFNNHMLFNRMVQLVNIKLEVMQEWQSKINPDYVVPLTSNQLRDMQVARVGYNVQTLSKANVEELPYQVERRGQDKGFAMMKGRKNSMEVHLHEVIAASKAQALESRKKKNNIFVKRRATGAGQNEGSEHWVISDLGSDNHSISGDSQSSYQSF